MKDKKGHFTQEPYAIRSPLKFLGPIKAGQMVPMAIAPLVSWRKQTDTLSPHYGN